VVQDALFVVALGLPMQAVEHVRDCIIFLLASAEVVRLHRARRYKGTMGMMRSGGNRPKLASALRIEGDLQLILPSFAERKAQKKVRQRPRGQHDTNMGRFEAGG
jgi:hypothetical protein